MVSPPSLRLCLNVVVVWESVSWNRVRGSCRLFFVYIYRMFSFPLSFAAFWLRLVSTALLPLSRSLQDRDCNCISGSRHTPLCSCCTSCRPPLLGFPPLRLLKPSPRAMARHQILMMLPNAPVELCCWRWSGAHAVAGAGLERRCPTVDDDQLVASTAVSRVTPGTAGNGGGREHTSPLLWVVIQHAVCSNDRHGRTW